MNSKSQNIRKSAASISKKDILEIVMLIFLIALWTLVEL